MAKEQRIHIDLDRTLETLRRGVRRADVFMGVGLNAADHDPPLSHILSPDALHTIQLVKQNLSDAEKAHVAAEFGKWVRANGLRELLETFSIFMYELYTALFRMLSSRDKLSALSRVPPERFERMGIGDQIETLSEVIAVQVGEVHVVRSLNQARNCYAHRRGLVGAVDVDATTEKLTLLWTVFQMELAEPDGNVVPEAQMYGRVFEKGGTVQIRISEKRKEIPRGEELVLDKRELKEICLCVLTIGQRLFKETVELARQEGILAEKVSSNLHDPKPV